MSLDVNSLEIETDEMSSVNRGFDPRETRPSVRRALAWTDLVETVEDDSVELVLWRRAEPSPVRATLDVPESEFNIIVGEGEDILTGVSDVFTESDWPASLRETVKKDVRSFLMASELKVPDSQYRLRLQAVSDDACRKFHQDRTFQRLILTYRGEGTVWRAADEATEHNAVEMECVLLRGKRAGRNPQILHRSPKFTPGQPPRLIMVIDVMPNIYGN